MLADDRYAEILHLGIGRHVDNVGPRRSTNRLDRLDGGGSPVGIDLDDLDEGPMLGEQPGDRSADAYASTGNHGNPVLQQPVPVHDLRDPPGLLCRSPGCVRHPDPAI